MSEKPGPGAVFPGDYHEYVFREGRLVGDFDNMYKHARDIPWGQDTRWRDWYAQVGMLMIRQHAPYEDVLEAGCGLGYISAQLRPLSRGAVDAFDVSPEAIRRAGAAHPGVRFFLANLTSPDFAPPRRYHLVVVREVFWYVTDHLEQVLRNLRACVRPGGYLYVGQSFPALDRPFVGKEVIADPDALMRRLGDFEPVSTALVRNYGIEADGPILHFFGTLRS